MIFYLREVEGLDVVPARYSQCTGPEDGLSSVTPTIEDCKLHPAIPDLVTRVCTLGYLDTDSAMQGSASSKSGVVSLWLSIFVFHTSIQACIAHLVNLLGEKFSRP